MDVRSDPNSSSMWESSLVKYPWQDSVNIETSRLDVMFDTDTGTLQIPLQEVYRTKSGTATFIFSEISCSEMRTLPQVVHLQRFRSASFNSMIPAAILVVEILFCKNRHIPGPPVRHSTLERELHAVYLGVCT